MISPPEPGAEPPRFSVVVPAFNEAAFLGATLRSLRSQSFPGEYEIIVVDNNSTDATAAIAASFGVRVISEPRPGVCEARQAGLAVARGEIVVSVDADTIYPPDWLRRIDLAFRGAPGIVAVGGPCRYRQPPWWIAIFAWALFGLVALVHRLFGWVGYVTATNVAFRRDAFRGYNLALTQGGDELDLLRRLRRRGRVVWDRTNVVLTSARRQDQGLVNTLVVSFFVYYLLAYWLNRLTAHRMLGMAPAFRVERRRGRRPVRWRFTVGAALMLTISLGVAYYYS